MAVEVPSFARAVSIRLHVGNLHLKPPAQGGDFPVLERLSIAAGRFDIDPLISGCPCLRVLEVHFDEDLNPITIHSATIEELRLTCHLALHLRGVDIVAPVLKKFTLGWSVHKDFSMSLLAPKVENLWWNCCVGFYSEAVVIDASGMWTLEKLKLGTQESGFVLNLDVGRPHSATHTRNLQEMFQLPNISVLELCVERRGHVYGAIALDILRICNATQKLKLVIDRSMLWTTDDDEACPPDCLCNQPHNWRSQNISLSLEEVEIVNFKGSGHEVDFLKLLFRCAPLTYVTLKLASKISPSSRGCKEIYKIFKANPAAECHVYRKRGKEIIYA